MIPRSFTAHAIFVSFIILVSISLGRAIQVQSIIGIILSLVSIGACIYFGYLLAKARRENEETA